MRYVTKQSLVPLDDLCIILTFVVASLSRQLRGLMDTVSSLDVYFSAIAYASDFDRCYDSDTTLNFDADLSDVPAEYAGVYVYIYDQIAKQASAETYGVIEGRAEFKVTQKGNAGAVRSVALDVIMTDLSITVFHDEFNQFTRTIGSGYASAYTDRLALCQYYKQSWFYSYYKCAETVGYVSAGTRTYATTYSVSSSDTASWNVGVAAAVVEVNGKNLQNFTALVLTGGLNFAAQEAEDLISTYVSTYMSVYERDFLKMYTRYCSWWGGCGNYNYQTVYDYAYQFASTYARAYAEAKSLALAVTTVQAGILAQYKRNPGDPENGNMIIDLAGDANAGAGALAMVGCAA